MDSKTAKLIKSKNTSIEMILRRKLYSLGYRYKIHASSIQGKPDIVFSGKKIAIFCDSAFWHGQKYLAGEKFKTNSEFWEHKISQNIERDAKVNSLLVQSGWKVLRFWDYEIKKDLDRCVEQIKLAYENNFGEDPHLDVTKLTQESTKSIPDFDILLAGFPCQTFSIAGIKKGFEDSRGQLFFYIARILKIKNPQAFLLENVKGLVSHERGNTLKTILKILTEELNYQVSYQILNSKDFGVPQNRERVYIAGFKRKADFTFPAPLGTKVSISDILEKGVAEKYFISERY